ncbi:hypothetical protein TNCV_4879721 [Trichonephila clavipes]|nr:hypothetical protein TNCV_4879721 [Trichonephila clavipes]
MNVHDSPSQKPSQKPARLMAALRLSELNDCLRIKKETRPPPKVWPWARSLLAHALRRLCVHQIPEINTRNLTSIFTRLRTGHFRDMKIQKNGTRKHAFCKHCHDMELDTEHLFLLSFLFWQNCNQYFRNKPCEDLYKDNRIQIADAVFRTFDPI